MYFVLAKQNSLQEVLSCVSVFSLSSPSTLESYRGPPCLALSGKNAYNSHQTTKKNLLYIVVLLNMAFQRLVNPRCIFPALPHVGVVL